jgi:putative inorganic carbon (hco3(-)) transporter
MIRDVLTRANATLAYIVLVLLLGGASAAGHGANLVLQVLGAGLIAWSFYAGRETRMGLRAFAVAFAVLAAVQFLPLPPALWSALPGRDFVVQGYALLGMPAPWLTLSLAPWKSLASLAWWIPALAILLSMRARGAPTTRRAVLAVGIVAGAAAILGFVQQTSGAGYIYRITNYGAGPGFFANSNHQGSFMLTALALVAALAVAQPIGARRRGLATRQMLIGLCALLVLGVLVSGSLACLTLMVPVLAAVCFIVRPDWRIPLPAVAGLGVAGLIGFVALLYRGAISNDLLGRGAVSSAGRAEYFAHGSQALLDFAPVGSGLGTFLEVYRRYENEDRVTTVYGNHAHNDLLELLMDTGLFGLTALGLFLAWFLPRAWRLWTGRRDNPLALAASVVIGVELVHSLVDYPLRTAAMSSVMALACVILVRPREAAEERTGRSGARTREEPRKMMRI